MMELENTVKMMLSKDYKDRLIAEYRQVGIRYLKLDEMVRKYQNDELDFTPKTPLKILQGQVGAMMAYMAILEHSAALEGVDLTKPLDGEE